MPVNQDSMRGEAQNTNHQPRQGRPILAQDVSPAYGLSPHTKAGALPFSRSLREGGAFRGPSVTARLVDFVLQIAQGLSVPHSGSWITCTATQCNAAWSRVLRIGRGAVPGTMPLTNCHPERSIRFAQRI
jgi:hypothetical protein